MSDGPFRWSGKYYKGAMRDRRAEKREEAEAMRAADNTPHERTKSHRLGRCRCADFSGRKPTRRGRR